MKNHDKRTENLREKIQRWKRGELTIDHFTSEERIELLEMNEISQEEFLSHLPKKCGITGKPLVNCLRKKNFSECRSG